MAGDEFSELLGQLKERSGLSYGVLAKRLHTSTSTLHRYINGDAVPTDYAPVERLARLCKATPEELVELHRRWVLADALRRQKATGAGPAEEARTEAAGAVGAAGTGAAGAVAAAGTGANGTRAAEPDTTTEPATTTRHDTTTGHDTTPQAGPAAEARSEVGPPEPAEVSVARRRRTVVLAGAAVVAALVAAALVVNLVPGEGDADRDGKRSVGAASQTTDSAGERRPGASEPSADKSRPASPSASRSGSPTVSPSGAAPGSEGAGAAEGGAAQDGATEPNVAVNPYKWEGPCSQHYLIDRKPEQVPPPPSEQDARGWVSALGGVAAGQQMLALTVQGTGKATVVLDALHVRVVEKSAPLAFNDFAMGVGCGGGVETTSFTVDLDAGRPATSPKAGQRDFPYKVSESDPEVFYIFADARAHNVSWYLELDWSSGGQKGTVRIDDNGKPFRTSGNVGRPAYNYPLGSSEWGRNEYEPDIPG